MYSGLFLIIHIKVTVSELFKKNWVLKYHLVFLQGHYLVISYNKCQQAEEHSGS